MTLTYASQITRSLRKVWEQDLNKNWRGCGSQDGAINDATEPKTAQMPQIKIDKQITSQNRDCWSVTELPAARRTRQTTPTILTNGQGKDRSLLFLREIVDSHKPRLLTMAEKDTSTVGSRGLAALKPPIPYLQKFFQCLKVRKATPVSQCYKSTRHEGRPHSFDGPLRGCT